MVCTIEDGYNSFRGKLKAFIASRTKDEAVAEDLVQETFVKLAGFQDVRITINATSVHLSRYARPHRPGRGPGIRRRGPVE